MCISKLQGVTALGKLFCSVMEISTLLGCCHKLRGVLRYGNVKERRHTVGNRYSRALTIYNEEGFELKRLLMCELFRFQSK